MTLVPPTGVCHVCDGFVAGGTARSRCRCHDWRCTGCGHTEQSPTRPDRCGRCGSTAPVQLNPQEIAA